MIFRAYSKSFSKSLPFGILMLSGALLLAACGKPVKPAEKQVPVTTTSEVESKPEPTDAPEPKAAPEPASPVAKAAAEEKQKSSTRAEKWMISAANPLAAETGRQILRKGGSAIDAAIAAQMVLNLVEPQSSGIGGGGFMLHFNAETGEIAAYDGRETAPATATPDMFLGENGKRLGFFDAVVGGLSVGAPGLLRMLEMAHVEHGRLPWPELFEPAIQMATAGFEVSPRLHGLVSKDKFLKTFGTTARYFYDEAGSARPVGHLLKNPKLARTLRRISVHGADAFYTGAIARDIVKTVGTASRNPGGLSMDDLKNYVAVKREPVCLFYRTWLICGMGPPSSGGLSSLQILGILQSFDMAALKPTTPGIPTVKAAHLIAEASRLAFADRKFYIADPDSIPVPAGGMLDPGYLERRSKEISLHRSLGEAFPGMPSGVWNFAPDDEPKGLSTTHISVIDAEGNAVSMTSSIENAFGSRLMTRGFLLNNQLTDFSFVPEKDGAPVANRAEPGKRPRSSMAPTLVFNGEGNVEMAIGSPGGSRIIGYVAKSLIAALDWDMDIQEAIDLPHLTNRNGPTDLEADTDAETLKPLLEALGHHVRMRSMTSGLHGIRVRNGKLKGGADHRREGVALGD